MKKGILFLFFIVGTTYCMDEFLSTKKLNFLTMKHYCCAQLEENIASCQKKDSIYAYKILKAQLKIGQYQRSQAHKKIVRYQEKLRNLYKEHAENTEHLQDLKDNLVQQKSIHKPTSFAQEYPPCDKESIQYQNFIAEHWQGFAIPILRKYHLFLADQRLEPVL